MSHGRYSSYGGTGSNYGGAGSSYGGLGSSYGSSSGTSYSGLGLGSSSYGRTGSSYLTERGSSSYGTGSGLYSSGGSSLGSSSSSLYKSYDYPSTSPSRSGALGYGALTGTGSSYRSPALSSTADRSLSFASASGAVSSMKGKFDRTSAGRDTNPSYASSSLDRYTARSNGSSDYSSKLGSGYTSDLDLSGGGRTGSSSYGSSFASGACRSYPSSSSYSSARSTSPPSSRAASKLDYSRPTSRDYGSTYTSPTATSSSSSSAATRAKSSSYSLTPFESRRSAAGASARSTDLNLTPFNVRGSSGSDSVSAAAAALPPRPSLERQGTVASQANTSSPTTTTTAPSKTEPSQSSTLPKPKRSTLSDSSDSAEEPRPGARRDPDVRYLTSRATSPMEVDREASDARKMDRKTNRNRLIARTKTKTYPVLDRKRRRQLKNVQLQVDIDELDKFAGRIRSNKEKLSKYTENKYGTSRNGPSVSTASGALLSTASEKSAATSSVGSSPSGWMGRRDSISSTKEPESVRTPVVLPKQSGFVPKDRKSSIVRDDDDVLPDDSSRLIRRSEPSRKLIGNEKENEQVVTPPKQSSFLERKRQQEEEEKKKKEQEINKKVAALAAAQKSKEKPTENLTLKDSIDKVRSWKKQMQEVAPDSPDEDENSVFGGKDWRKNKQSRNLKLQHPSHRRDEEMDEQPTGLPPLAPGHRTTALSPPASVRSDSDRSSEVGFSRDASPNTILNSSREDAERSAKMCAGVPKFPSNAESIANRAVGSKGLKVRDKTSKDNLRNAANDNYRSPSPYDNEHDEDSMGRSKHSERSKARNCAFTSNESLGGFGGDVSSSGAGSSDEEEEKGDRGRSGVLNRTNSMASLSTADSWSRRRAMLLRPRPSGSMNNLATTSSITSLPDLVTSSEGTGGKNRTGYIGKLRDIDSFLGFDDTEDEEFSEKPGQQENIKNKQRKTSEEEGRQRDEEEEEDRRTCRKNNENLRKGISSGSSAQRSGSPALRIPAGDDQIFIGDTEDIDEILGNDLVTTYLGVTLSLPTSTSGIGTDQAKNSLSVMASHPSLRLNLTSTASQRQPSQADINCSTESLLDTPVPDTPDIPLSPMPVFFPSSFSTPGPAGAGTSPARRAMSTDQLNMTSGNLFAPSSTGNNKFLSAKERLGSPDDFDAFFSRTSCSSGTKETPVNNNDLPTAAGVSSRGPRSQKSPPTDTLIDLSFDTEDGGLEEGGMGGVGRLEAMLEEQTMTSKVFYPSGYSDAAVAEAVARHAALGQVTITDLVKICRRHGKKKKPPWVEDEEDRRFTGYSDIRYLLEYMDVDVKKLEDCAVELYRCAEASSDKTMVASYLQPQSSFDDNLLEFNKQPTDSKCEVSASVTERLHLSVKVHAFIDKLLSSNVQELRRALFSLKQIFKVDKDLTREFIYSNGLASLITIAVNANHSYQSYILRALGQLMLYVEGMNGVVSHNETIQWLYTLCASNVYPLVKTALRLLLMFVDYSDCNAFLVFQAVSVVSSTKGTKMWFNLMELVKEKNPGQSDLSIMAMTLINKVLSSIPDQDTFYDMADALEDQDMEKTVLMHMARKGTCAELLQQLGLYETMVREEDAVDSMQLDLIQNARGRRSRSKTAGRKSKRHAKSSKIKKSQELSEEFRKPMAHKWRKAYDEEEEGKAWAVGTKKQLHYRQPSTITTEQEPSSTSGSGPIRHVLRSVSQSGDGGPPLSPTTARRLAAFSNSQSGQVQNLAPKIISGVEGTPAPPEGEFSGLLNKAKDGLSYSSRSFQKNEEATVVEVKPVKSEAEQQWEEIEKAMQRALKIKEMDFTDLTEVDDINYVNAQPIGGVPPVQAPAPSSTVSKLAKFGGGFGTAAGAPAPGLGGIGGKDRGRGGALPPPPPPPPGGMLPPPPPPPPFGLGGALPPPPPPPMCPPPPPGLSAPPLPPALNKNGRKTLRLHWREGKAEFYTPSGRINDTIWSKMSRELVFVKIDKDSLAELFESKASELKIKPQDGSKKELTVLDSKRSNAINIGLTALPPARTIKTAILNMDSVIMNRECVEKILTTMLPTEEEKTKMMEAQMAHPDLPLGSAEQFLLTISSITALESRLQLWAFTLDYEGIEKEIAESISDLRLGMEELRRSRTLKYILALLLSLGNCLNNGQARGFTIDYLSRVPEVKDTVQKHSLLHHLVTMVIEQFPDSTDLFSEIGAVNRCSKLDWDEMVERLTKLETNCKASWDHLRTIVKHDNTIALKNKLSNTLSDFAERIIILKTIHRRIINRFHRFLLYFGYSPDGAQEVKIGQFCKTIVEFALEYRTVREKIVQQREKKISQTMTLERRTSRSKVSLDDNNLETKYHTLDGSHRRNSRAELEENNVGQQLLTSGRLAKYPSLSKLESRKSCGSNSNLSGQGSESETTYDTGDEDILEAMMRTAAASSDRRPRDKRKSSRDSTSTDRKSWRSTTSVSRDRNGY